MRFLRLPLAALAGLLLLTACPSKAPDAGTDAAAPEAPLPKAPVFNADSAYAFTAKQVAFGPRVPNSKAHVACGDWLVAKLKSYKLKLLQQPFDAMTFDGTNIHARNIIAQYQPQAARRVAIFGHWDTRPFADADKVHKNAPMDGASDGASAVAVAVEMARVLSQQPDSLAPAVGVDFIFFDAEDWGYETTTQAGLKDQLEESATSSSWCLGSQYWAAHLLPAGYKAEYGVLLDMVGAKGGTFTREGTSRENALGPLNKIWNTAARLGYSDYFRYQDTGSITDDHVFANKAGVPTIDIYHYNNSVDIFPAYHHTTADNMSIIDRKTLKAVGQTMLQTLYVD